MVFAKGYRRLDSEEVTVDEAVAGLKGRIRRPLLTALANAARATAIGFKLALALITAFAVEILFFAGSGWLSLVFLVTCALLAHEAHRKLSEGRAKRHCRNAIRMGSSFRHQVEGSRGGMAEAGHEGDYWLDYLHQPNRNITITGSTRSGKTQTLLALVSRIYILNGIRFMLIDWNGELEDWARRANVALWRVPANLKINLFALNGMGREERASMAVETLMASAHFTALQAVRIKSALLKFYGAGGEPSLLDLWGELCGGRAGKMNVLNQRLRSIQRVIGTEPEEFWKSAFSRSSVISLAGLNESEKALLSYALLSRLAELLERNPELRKGLRLSVVMDETWQFLMKARQFEEHRAHVLERIVRQGEKYGFGVILSTQQIDDMPKPFINSSSVIIAHQNREFDYYGRDALGLDSYERAYLQGASQGEALVFDRALAQQGSIRPEYVRIEPLKASELHELAAKSDRYSPRQIMEPQMPLEESDGKEKAESREGSIADRLRPPAVPVYRLLVALRETTSISRAYAMLRERGWATSDRTIYGGGGKPSLLGRARASGYVNAEGKLTDKALNFIDAERLIAKQGPNAGSEEHRELMRSTIRKIQEEGNFVFTLGERESFDVGEIRAKTRSSWDLEHVTAYECQTNAIKEEIEKCVARAGREGTGLVFVAAGETMKEAIAAETNGTYACIAPQ